MKIRHATVAAASRGDLVFVLALEGATLEAGPGLRRVFSWDGLRRGAIVKARSEGFANAQNPGLTFDGTPKVWEAANGVAKLRYEEGVRNYDNIDDATIWMQIRRLHYAYNNSGIVVGWQQNGDTLRSVYYMNADGSERTMVAEKARQPCWSPDGTRIAFVNQLYDRFRVEDHLSKGLFIYDLKSGLTSQHPNDEIEHLYGLSWTGDGDWIVSTVHGGMGFGHAILAIDVDGEQVHDLNIGGCRPCRSPDGRQITWSRDDHTICVGDIELSEDDGQVSNVRVIEHHETAHLYHPDFSPDGKQIAFSVGPGGRVLADGPGTHTQVAEMVGVRGKWNLFSKQVNGEGTAVQLTVDENLSSKEPEWICAE